MKRDPLPWLPDSALTGAAMDQVVSTILSHWERRWFAGAEGLNCRNLSTQPCDGTFELVLFDGGHVRVSADNLFQLGRMISGISVAVSWTTRDRLLLTQVAREALAEIGSDAAGEPNEAPSIIAAVSANNLARANRPGLRFLVEDVTGFWSFDLWIDQATAIAMRRRFARAGAASPSPAIEPLRSAIARQSVSLGASLGVATMPVAAVKGLAEGDVIVLDRKTSDPLPVTLDRCVVPEFLIHLSRADESYQAKVVCPLPLDAS